MKPDLLLTGATGFVGNYLCRTLAARGRSFVALVRETSDLRPLRELAPWCTPVVGDVTDVGSLTRALEGIGTVIHAAALVSYQPGDRDAMLHTNVGGTANVVNAMLGVGTPRLIHLSSVAALQRVSNGPVVGVNNRWAGERPNTSYAESKVGAEREVWRGQAEGLSVAALYPSIILGAGNWEGQNTPALWRNAARERRIYPGGSAGFVDVRDVVNGVLTVLDRRLDGDRFLLNAANLSWRELLTAIAVSVGARPPSHRMPTWQSSLLWPLEALRGRLAGRPPLITRESHRNVQAVYRYDGRPFVRETGREYLPIATTIEETGKAFLLARAAGGDALPPTYLPVV